MNKVTKVSIGGIAFTLEEDAYQLLDGYLNKLNNHYSSNPNGKEIIEGLEERMAELFIDRGGKTGILSYAVTKEVIGIVGTPEEIFGESESPKSDTREVKKRLYRNPFDKIIGGVCGGFGAYFKVDPVWLRVGLVALMILIGSTDHLIHWNIWSPGYVFLLYVIFWICIPMARTTEQKCAMRGEPLSYGDPEKHYEHRKEYEEVNHTGRRFWAIAGGCLLFIPGIILLIVGLAGFIGIVAALFGIAVAGLSIPAFLENIIFTSMPFAAAGWFPLSKVLITLAAVLPFIGMLYGGIMLIFKIKAPKWRPGLVIFVLWILSLIGVILMGVNFTKNYWNHNKQLTSEYIQPQGDALYVEFEDVDKWDNMQKIIHGDREEYAVIYVDTERKDSASVVVYPFVKVNRNEADSCSINVSSNLFNTTMTLDELKEKKELSFYRFHGDTLTLSPAIYGKGRPVQEIGRKVVVNIPENMRVVIDDPIYHQFDNEFEYSNMNISPERIKELEKLTEKFNVEIDFDNLKNK